MWYTRYAGNGRGAHVVKLRLRRVVSGAVLKWFHACFPTREPLETLWHRESCQGQLLDCFPGNTPEASNLSRPFPRYPVQGFQWCFA